MPTRKKQPRKAAPAPRVTTDVSHIKITLDTKDGLREITFELQKTTQNGVDKWTLTFQLLERAKKTDPFIKIVDLLIEVEKKLNPKAQAIANNSLTKKQAAYLIGPGGDKSKDKDPAKAKKAVQDTLNK